MRKILASILALFGVRNASGQEPVRSGDPAIAGLRNMALELSASEIGLDKSSFPHRVWGVAMETGMEGGFYTLVVLADGTTSIYFSNGGGIIGAGSHEEVRKASGQFLGWANHFVESSTPDTSIAVPAKGQTQFYFLTFDGRRVYEAKEIELGEERDTLSPLFHAGHAVIAAARAVSN